MANFHGLVFICLCFAMLMASVSATQHRVGGSMGWTVPTGSNAMSYRQWAERYRFQIGDSLLFVYLPGKDSVFLVDAAAYNSCNTSTYIDEFNDGNTVFTFTRSGPFHFISGNRENCLKNEKLVVVVMADRSKRPSSATAPSPATVESSPPPPAGEGSTSPPAPPNRASAKLVGEFMAMIGGFLGSLFLVL